MTSAHAPRGTDRQSFRWLTTSDGIRLRHGFWRSTAATPQGTLLLLHGRSEYMEKYREVIDELNTRGFDVVSFDWRGQGLSERLLSDPSKGYVNSFDRYMIDLESVVDHARYHCQGPLVLLAHSMGGHLALRYLRKYPGRFSRTVLCAPMIDINTSPIPQSMARLFSRLLRSTGFARSRIAGATHFDPYGHRFECNRITSDRTRYERIQQTTAANPSLAAPHVTNGWLAAAFDSIDVLHRPGFNNGIASPLLVVMAGRDQIVVNQAIRRFTDRLPCCRTLFLEDARHEILQERDAIRSRFWEAFDAFARAAQE